MTGNLSYQIEHHLFPDLPSNRYQEIAPRVKAIFDEYGLTYVTGPLPRQVASAWSKVVRLSLPNDFIENIVRSRKPATDGPLAAADDSVEGSSTSGRPVDEGRPALVAV